MYPLTVTPIFLETIDYCCLTGFNWSGTPQGETIDYHGRGMYQTGSNEDAAVLLIHDLLGWTFPNTRLLADHYAKEANVTVYLPDFFGGEVLPADIIHDLSRWGEVDVKGFIARNSKEIRRKEIFAIAYYLRSKYKRLGAIGFCFGGWAVFELGAKAYIESSTGQPLVDCISTAHPSLLTKEDIDNVGVPVQILAPEHDPAFSQELKDHCNKVIPTLGVQYDYRFFPGVEHAFATRGNPQDAKERSAMRQAKNAAVGWFQEFLFEQKDS